MSTAGIICEYNPYHRGHAYQTAELRRRCPDAAVVCVLSGGFVQRGEPAMLPTDIRAEAALFCGADLVLLLPFPWSMGPAECFARAGTAILSAVGCEMIAFGTEGDVLPVLQSAAAHLSSSEFEAALGTALADAENAGVGYPALRDSIYRRLYGDAEADILRTPNNLLAAEYLRAAPKLSPLAIPRIGDAHGSVSAGTETASSTAVRALLSAGKTEAALALLPPPSAQCAARAEKEGRLVFADSSAASALLLRHFRTADKAELARCAGLSGGLAGRLCSAAAEAAELSAFFSLAATKKYTDAAVRRAAWYGFFGVTEEEIRGTPPFVQVLALNARGAEILHAAKKSTPVPILSRPAAYKNLPAEAQTAFLRNVHAEAVRELLCARPRSFAELLRSAPFSGL